MRSTSGSPASGAAHRGTRSFYRARAGIAAALLIGCIFIADRFGLVALIGSGYRSLAYALLAVYVVPLLTIGIWRLVRASRVGAVPLGDQPPVGAI